MPADDFQSVLSAAIEDMIANGFDSMERVANWTRRLREAAERSLISAAALEDQLRGGLAAVYRRMVEQGEVFKYNPGVERFTLDKIKPKLRSELDRRIAASADLIKLNRAQAIDKTLQRFQGWSTSIPPGGISAEKKRDVKDNVRKSLSSLPFEERRVVIDQGHKLTAAISEIVAGDGGAIAGRWRSNWRQAGYDYREDHKERDDQIYLIRDSWAHRAGMVKKGGRPFYDEITAVGQEPFCRCYMIWLYNLRDLPADMLTSKGKTALGSAQSRRADARIDAAALDITAATEQTLDEARPLDRLGYLSGVMKIQSVPDRSDWHASYDNTDDRISVQAKFDLMPGPERVHVLLHEAGHRGQEVDRATYVAFKRRHLNTLTSFLDMANPVHIRDYERTGSVDSLVAEVFAESYARAMTGAAMPAELMTFWTHRLGIAGERMSQKQAAYTAIWPNKITRCRRCSMFYQLHAGVAGNACSAVEGDISASGHCRLFEIGSVRADDAGPEPIPAVGYEAIRRCLDRLEKVLSAR